MMSIIYICNIITRCSGDRSTTTIRKETTTEAMKNPPATRFLIQHRTAQTRGHLQTGWQSLEEKCIYCEVIGSVRHQTGETQGARDAIAPRFAVFFCCPSLSLSFVKIVEFRANILSYAVGNRVYLPFPSGSM